MLLILAFLCGGVASALLGHLIGNEFVHLPVVAQCDHVLLTIARRIDAGQRRISQALHYLVYGPVAPPTRYQLPVYGQMPLYPPLDMRLNAVRLRVQMLEAELWQLSEVSDTGQTPVIQSMLNDVSAIQQKTGVFTPKTGGVTPRKKELGTCAA